MSKLTLNRETLKQLDAKAGELVQGGTGSGIHAGCGSESYCYSCDGWRGNICAGSEGPLACAV